MAIYFWLGRVANGDVNTPLNWTFWSPQSVTGAGSLPASAPTIPKYGDSLRFERFGLCGTAIQTYPIFGPSGQLDGLCGPAGATTLQWVESIFVHEKCPVPIGSSSSPFTVRTSNLFLNISDTPATNYDGTFAPLPGATSPSYIHLLSGIGATKPDANIAVFAKKMYTYNITGVAKNLTILNTNLNPSYSTLNLYGLSLSNSISDNNPNARKSYDLINIDSTTKIGGGVFLFGEQPSVQIRKGFTGNTVFNLNSIYDGSTISGPKLFVLTEGATGLDGSSGPTSPKSRFYLTTNSNSKFSPYVQIGSGVDIVSLNQNGGRIFFDLPATVDSATISTGVFNPLNSKMLVRYGNLNISALSIDNGEYPEDSNIDPPPAPDISIMGMNTYSISPATNRIEAISKSTETLIDGGKIESAVGATA